MKTVIATLICLAATGFVNAKTYIITSGKWTDAKVWNNQYPGTTIQAGDVVIIKGQIVLTTAIIIEGTLQVDKGACMMGMQTLVISNQGTFINNGNTIMKSIVNEGTINNNQILETKADADNTGTIDNNNLLSAGHNFNNLRGTACGKGGVYVADNNINAAPEATFGKNVRFLEGNETQHKLAATRTN